MLPKHDVAFCTCAQPFFCPPFRGGRKGGNASMAAEAAGHERDAGVASDRLGGGAGGPAGGRLEMKAPRGGGAGGHGRQHMLMDEDEVRVARGLPNPPPVGGRVGGGWAGGRMGGRRAD